LLIPCLFAQPSQAQEVPVFAPVHEKEAPLDCFASPNLYSVLKVLPTNVQVNINPKEVKLFIELVKSEIHPPRLYPLVGMAQLHECHYKCTLYYTERLPANDPNAQGVPKQRSEVIYIDRDHLHVVDKTDAK